MMGTEIVFEMLDNNSILTQLIAQEDFRVYCHSESYKLYIMKYITKGREDLD
jgi:hypothetical protein